MPRSTPILTKKQIQSLPFSNNMKAVGGLVYLRKKSPDSQSWVFQAKCKACRKEHPIGLGSAFHVTVETARKLAAELYQRVTLGECLQATRAAEKVRNKALLKQAITFEQAMTEALPIIYQEMKDRKKAQWENTLKKYALPYIGAKKVAEIGRDDIIELLTQSCDKGDNFWENMTQTATKVRQRIERIIRICIVNHDLAISNPASWDNGLRELLANPEKLIAKNKRAHPKCPVADAPAMARKLLERGDNQSLCLYMVMVTAKRVSEVMLARWEEVDLDRRLWIIPRERLEKSDRDEPFYDPLPDQLIEILTTLPTRSAGGLLFVNKNGGPFKDSSLSSRYPREFEGVPHGLRKTFGTWRKDFTDYPADLGEVQLTHHQGALEETYHESSAVHRRREMMQTYANFLEFGVTEPVSLERIDSVYR